jgi:hypothetical protein
MSTQTINVVEKFSDRLVNRNRFQGDGRFTAEDFRRKFLKFLDNEAAWLGDEPAIIFDFSEVDNIGPSFANEAFAYFIKYAPPEKILKKIQFVNISKVKMGVITEELDTSFHNRE